MLFAGTAVQLDEDILDDINEFWPLTLFAFPPGQDGDRRSDTNLKK